MLQQTHLARSRKHSLMLISPDYRIVVSTLGWVDKSSLWTYDVVKESVNQIPLGNANYLSLYACKDTHQFAVLHHSDGDLIRLTVHAFENPAIPLCTIEKSADQSQVEGNPDLLHHAPRYYVAYYDPGHDADFYLISIDPSQQQIQTERFDWYDNSYDKMYQGIVGVIENPSGELIVSVQRDSTPIVYDPKTKKVLKKLTLANRHGNPKFRLTKHRGEIWADDYDTILKMDVDTLTIKGSRRMQASLTGSAEFIGDWSFDEEESLCLVSRPFSGDVAAISTDNLKTRFVASTGGQPIEAIFLNNGKLIGRDWKTGNPLMGSLQRKWFTSWN